MNDKPLIAYKMAKLEFAAIFYVVWPMLAQKEQRMPELNPQARLLITDEERILYVGGLHFMHGFKWFMMSVASFFLALMIGGGTWLSGGDVTRPLTLFPTLVLAVVAAVTWVVYCLPFWRSFFVVTDQRALVGVGQFTIVQEQILAHQLVDWEIRDNYIETMFGFGHLTLRLMEGRQIRIIQINYLREPHLFTRFIDEISPIKARALKEGFDTEEAEEKQEKQAQKLEQNLTAEQQKDYAPPR